MKRFWDKVDIHGEDDCWEWQAYIAKDGYGKFKYQGKNISASRITYILTHGEIEKGLVIMHKCNNKSCCNPNHLEMGTYSKNTQDAYDDGLIKPAGVNGQDHYKAKLTEKEVLNIRSLFSNGGISKLEISKIYDVGKTAIQKIIKRRTWKHI